MDTARDKYSLEIVDSEELWYMEEVDREGYICVSCSLKATPCSFDKGRNKRRPYFRFDHPDNHDYGCSYEQEKRLADKAKRKSISGTDGLPLSYPSKLSLADVRRIPSPHPGIIKPRVSKTISGKTQGSKTRSDTHHYSVKSIAPICRRYVEFPYDRRQMQLEISGIHGENYDEVIKRLPNEIVVFRRKKLRVGRLNNYRQPGVNSNRIEISLLNGDWIGGTPITTYKVVIDKSGWSKSRAAGLVNLVEDCQQEYKEKKRRGTYVFFIGEQSQDDPTEFVVTDHRLFSCISY